VTILGIAGTAKNTGKTTTLSALLEEGRRRGVLPGLTGIGYDGEERDTVTNLPKPRLQVYPGMIVTTSERCLDVSTARGEILSRTGFRTPLGEVLILRITRAGLLVVAGPNKSAELSVVCASMENAGAGVVFVDGSLNRIAPFSIAHAVVFASGAARSTEPQVVRREILGIETIFSFGKGTTEYFCRRGIRMRGKDVTVHLAGGSMHGAVEIAEAAAKRPEGIFSVEIPGVLTEEGFQELARSAREGRLRGDLILDDPIKVLLGGDPSRMAGHLQACSSAGLRPLYRARPSLCGFTVNPSYPAFDGTIYTPARVEAGAYVGGVREGVSVRVFDIVGGGGAGELLDLCLAGLESRRTSRNRSGK